jgi:hypothetical protein
MAKRAAATATTGAQAEPTEHSAIGDDRLRPSAGSSIRG